MSVRAPLAIVITAYGENPFLQSTLSSVMANVPPTTPTLLLDDSSESDFVRMTSRPYGKRVLYRRTERRLGVAGAFNRALEISDADYTLILGHDDVVLPGLVPSMIEAILVDDVPGMIQAGIQVIDRDGNPSRELVDMVKRLIAPRGDVTLSGQRLVTRLAAGNWMYHPGIAWRTQLALSERFDESMLVCMDMDLALRLAFAGHSLRVLSEPGVSYRRHPASVSSALEARTRFDEETRVYRWCSEQARQRGWWPAYLLARTSLTTRINAVLRTVANRPQATLARANRGSDQ